MLCPGGVRPGAVLLGAAQVAIEDGGSVCVLWVLPPRLCGGKFTGGSSTVVDYLECAESPFLATVAYCVFYNHALVILFS